MERKKITNWRDLLPMMVNYWFEVHEIEQQVQKFIYHKERIEIVTSTRVHFYGYDEIESVLYDWHPVGFNSSEMFNILDHAIFEDGTFGNLAKQNMDVATIAKAGIKEMNLFLLRENYMLFNEHKASNRAFKEKQKDMLDKLSTTAAGHNFPRDAQVLSQMIRDRVDMNTQELKDLALFQRSLQEANRQVTKNKETDDNKPKE